MERLSDFYQPGESGRRMVRKDVNRLREWGFEIRSKPRLGYLIVRNPFGAPLTNDDVDALAVLRDSMSASHPLSPHMSGLLALLTAFLDDSQRQRYALPSPLRLAITTAADYSQARALLPALQRAIQAEERVAFQYYSLAARDQPRFHEVDPYVVEFKNQQVYLVAYSSRLGYVTDFRLDQIVPGSFRPLQQPIGEKRDLYPYHFRYRLSKKLAERGVSERFAHQRVVETLADGSVVIEARARSDFLALRGLLHYAENAVALAPLSLVRETQATLRRMVSGYEAEDEFDGWM